MLWTFSLLIVEYISLVQSLSIFHQGSCFIFNFLIEYLSFTPWTFYILTCIHLFYFCLLTLDNFLLFSLLSYFNSRFSNLQPIVSVFLLILPLFPFSSFVFFFSSLIYLYVLFDFTSDYQIVSFYFQLLFSLIFFLLSDRSALRSFSLLSVHTFFFLFYIFCFSRIFSPSFPNFITFYYSFSLPSCSDLFVLSLFPHISPFIPSYLSPVRYFPSVCFYFSS